jgi:hypothetical protein
MVALPEPLVGPRFSTYSPEEVSWLLTDLSGAELEMPVAQRDERIRAGVHYAESLPVEYRPSAEYLALVQVLLGQSARRVAYLVGVVTETVLAARGVDVVLVSLARAGTPVGILMRRWGQQIHQLTAPHYTMSIVRGRGVDMVALRYLARHHDPARVIFVDGWTGKGTITRELRRALAHAATDGLLFPAQLAVLADPGCCAHIYGTRRDTLIPSACLNSTISGLVSRTVLHSTLLGPHDFHGAKFYPQLAQADLSNHYLDAISARFGEVADLAARSARRRAASPRPPKHTGWAAARRIGSTHGVDDMNFVKPGVGETTRALLRRVPWKVLIDRISPPLPHIRLLATHRRAHLLDVGDLPFSCVALIHPRGSAP